MTPLEFLWLGSLASICGMASMLLYARLSPQERLRELKAETQQIQQAIASYDGEFQGAMELTRQNLAVSFRRLGVALLPSVVSGIPVIGAVLFIGGHYITFFVIVAIASLATKHGLGIE